MKLQSAAKIYIKFVPIAAFSFLILILAFYALPRANFSISTDPSYWGAFGDYVGGILNPLFGIFTLIGLALSIYLQNEILEVQKEELANTRKELERSTTALVIQNKTMLAQNFEGTFFQMLRRQSELLEAFSYKDARGLEAVDLLIRRVKERCHQGNNHLEVYESIYNQNNSSLGPYFRNLYHALKLIDTNQHLDDTEKIKYSSLFRAQFSSKEIVLIFHNCLSQAGLGLKPLIIQYRMLKHIDKTWLANPDLVEDATLYPPETYSARD